MENLKREIKTKDNEIKYLLKYNIEIEENNIKLIKD